MLPSGWLEKCGEGVRVGVCDTGLESSLHCFKDKKITYKTFGNASPRHGTHVASTIFGLAPKAEMIFAGGIMDSYAKLEQMLEWLSQFRLDVLNLSLAFPEKDQGILKLLRKMNNTVIVCSWAKECPFPWSEPEFLSAGREGDFKAPNEWTAFSSGGYKAVMKGSSVSAAVTSGLCALGKAVLPGLDKKMFLELVSPEDIPRDYRPLKRQVNLKL